MVEHVQGAGSKDDVYVDSDGNVWILRKGESQGNAIYTGTEEHIENDPELRPDEQRGRRRNPAGGRQRDAEDDE